MALNDFVKVIKKSALLAHLQNVDEKTAKWRKDLLDTIVTKDELVIQMDYLSDSHDDLTDRDLPNQHPASAVAPDVTDFDGGLSATDDDLQTALETIDDDLGHAIHDNVSSEISAITEKTSPVNTDIFIIEDSESSYAKKKIQMGKITIGGASNDDVIEFDDDEGYIDDALLTVYPDPAVWYNVVPPEEEDSPHWQCQMSQHNTYFEGDPPYTYPDDAVDHADDCAFANSTLSKHFCARYLGRTYSDGVLDIWFRIRTDYCSFGGIALCDTDEFSQTTGLYCGQVILQSGTSTPGVGFVITTDLSDASWQADPDKEYTKTWGYNTTNGIPTNTSTRTSLAYMHHLRVDLLGGTAKHRAWNSSEINESTIYPTDSDWGEEIEFNHPLGNPISVFLFADKTSAAVNYGYTYIFSLRILNTIDGVVIEDGIQHDDLGGLADDDHMQYILADGTRELTDDWDAGAHEIRAETFESDVATGTAPLVIASETLVDNLNADLLDGNEATAFAAAGHDHDSAYISVIAAPGDNKFPYQTATGELDDSTYDADSFAAASHEHVEADITDLDHTDASAVHDNVAGEINAVADKATPDDADVILIEDSVDSWAKKKITVSDIAGSGTDNDAIHDNVNGEIQAIAAKSPPVGADVILIEDSEATWAKKSVTLTDVVTLAGVVTDHGGLDGLSDDDHTQYLLADGTRGLSADWDAGTWEIRANTFESDVATGTAPLTVASVTEVTNLNSEFFGGLGISGTPAAEIDEFITYYDSGSYISIQGSGYSQIDFVPRLMDDAAITMTVYNNTGSQIDAEKVCYISGDSSGTPLITLADADAASTASKMLVITNANIANAASGVATIYGWFGGLSSLTAGAIQYLSTSVGDMTETAPSGTGDIVRIVGYAMSATEMFFNPDKTYIELV